MKIKQLAVFGLVALTAGCATMNRTPEEVVEQRAQARWDLMVERNAGEAWAYYTPGYRDTVDRRDFAYDVARKPVRWLQAEVLSVECEPERCKVRANVTYHVPSAQAGRGNVETTRVVEETWIRSERQWWYVVSE